MDKPRIRFKGYTEAWERRKLGDYCNMFNGDRSPKYPNADDMVSDGIPFINAGDLENGTVNLMTCNRISREKYNDLGGAKLQRGDIVYCLRGTLGKNAFIDNFDEGTVASSLVALRPKNIDGKYLYFILNSDIEYRQRIVRDEGAAQPNLSAKSVSEYIIPVPSVAEQKQVSAYFSTLDRLITLHQRKCDETKTLKKYMLQNMFPQNGSNVPKIRFDGFTEAWEQRKLGEIAGNVIGGGTPKTSVAEYWDGSIPWIQSSNVQENRMFEFEIPKSITQLGLDKSAAKLFPQNSIAVVTHVGVGKLVFVPFSYATSQDFTSLAELKIDAKFTCYSLYQRIQNDLHIVQGSAIKGITKEDLLTKEIMVPEIEEQKRIGEYFRRLDRLITLHQRKCDELLKIKKFMLQNMFV